MDWKRIEREVSTLDTLSPEAALKRLEDLQQTDPEIAALVAGYAGRRRNVDSFLRTMAPQAARVVDTLKPGVRLGVWELEDMLGRGGMGAVYKARRADGLYEQSAAVKVVRISSDAQRVRFDQERQRLARLEHPGVVRIIDGGITDDDLAFLVMEYVDGAPLDEWLADQKADREQVLRVAVEAARALSHVHGRLILHRDIKPANVLVSKDGQVKLIDFGIGSEFGDADDAPFAMTLAFAAPEQLNQQSVNIGSDIFGFGAMLHKLLTGALPLRRSDGGVDIDKALLKDKELVAIIARATAFDPAERYGAVDGLIEDLQHYLNKEPVDAYSTARVYRIGKFFSRYPASSALAASLLVALIGGLGASLYSADRAQKALVRAENALEREQMATVSEAAYSETIQGLFGAEMENDALTAALLKRAREADAAWRQDPDRAAMIAFAVGRSLVFQGDYVNAVKVLEPWLEAGYGAEHLRWQGQVDLAYALEGEGEFPKALETYKNAQTYFALISDEPTYESVLTAHRIAMITNSQDAYIAAVDAAKRGLTLGGSGNEILYYYDALTSLYQRLGRPQDALEAVRGALDYIQSRPLLDKHRTNIFRLQGASFEIYLTHDYARAREFLAPMLSDPSTGAQNLAIAHHLAGLSLLEERIYSAAREHFETARGIALKSAGPRSPLYTGIIADLVETEILSGDVEKGRARLDAYADEVDGDPPPHPYLIVTEALYLTAIGDNEAALSLLAAHRLRPSSSRRALTMQHRMNRLRDMGLDVDSLDQPVQTSDGESK